MKVAQFRTSIVLAAAAPLAGCASVSAHKGAVIDRQLASSVQPGVDNKASVEKLLGRPSFTGQFTPNDWYYVSRDTRQVAFRNPGVTKQLVLHVRFDQAGNVTVHYKTNYGQETYGIPACLTPANEIALTQAGCTLPRP